MESSRRIVDKGVDAEQVGQQALGHVDLGARVLLHEEVVGAVEAAFLEELADEEAGKVLGLEGAGSSGRH